MASGQYQWDQLSSEERRLLDELIEQVFSEDSGPQALAVVAQNDGLMNTATSPNLIVAGPDPKVGLPNPLLAQITIIAGALKNQTKGSLSVFKTHKWAGHVVKKYSDPLTNLGAFTMSAIQNKGVKAVVVYSGKNKAGVDCAWLLAFAHTKALGSSIYAECGRKSKFNNINWAQIEKKLNDAGPLTRAIDKETGTGVYATIVGTGGKYAVGAAFTG